MAKRMPDLFGSGEVRVLRLETATGLLSLAVVVLTCMLLWQKLSGLPVCYGTAEVAPGLIVPNEVPEAHVRSLSEQIALVLYNNTWETAEAGHNRVAQLLHPQLLGVFIVRMEHERALMKEHNPEHAAEHPQHGGRQVGGRVRRPRGGDQKGIRGNASHSRRGASGVCSFPAGAAGPHQSVGPGGDRAGVFRAAAGGDRV